RCSRFAGRQRKESAGRSQYGQLGLLNAGSRKWRAIHYESQSNLCHCEWSKPCYACAIESGRSAMISQVIEKEIIVQLSQLALDQQQQVLNFARALVMAKPVGRTGADLLRYAGMIDAADLNAIRQAIEEGCEQVNLNEW